MVFLLVRLGIRHIFLLILPNVYIFNSYPHQLMPCQHSNTPLCRDSSQVCRFSPESALITSRRIDYNADDSPAFRSRYSRPIRPIIYEPYSCKSLFNSGVESNIFNDDRPKLLLYPFVSSDYPNYMIFIHESMIQILGIKTVPNNFRYSLLRSHCASYISIAIPFISSDSFDVSVLFFF